MLLPLNAVQVVATLSAAILPASEFAVSGVQLLLRIPSAETRNCRATQLNEQLMLTPLRACVEMAPSDPERLHRTEMSPFEQELFLPAGYYPLPIPPSGPLLTTAD